MAASNLIDDNTLRRFALDYAQDRAQILFAVSLGVIFSIGWLTALVVIGLGRYLNFPRVEAVGSIGLGVMTIATPLGVYVSLILQRGGTLEATLLDLALLSTVGFLGGIISTVAFFRIWSKASMNKTR